MDIIREHHGTTLVEYFYREAMEQAAQSDARAGERPAFRYPGPKPRTKEAAIVMLADCVESASRTITDPTPGKLENLVLEIARGKLADGQFDECNITMAELKLIEIEPGEVAGGHLPQPHQVSGTRPVTGGVAPKITVSIRRRSARVTAREVRVAAVEAAGHSGKAPLAISVTVVGDRSMRELNRTYAGVLGTTDVLALDLSEDSPGGEETGGEVIVNADEAVAQAAKRGVRRSVNFFSTSAHGVLHLGGYRDGTTAQKRRMRAAERAVMREVERRIGEGLRR